MVLGSKKEISRCSLIPAHARCYDGDMRGVLTYQCCLASLQLAPWSRLVSSRHLSCLVRHQLTNEQKWCKSLVLTKLSLSITLIFHWLIIIWNEVIELSAFELFLFLMHRDELVGIQTIWWVDYQLAVGFLTGSWKSNMDVWISNQLFGNPTACLSWPRCNGGKVVFNGLPYMIMWIRQRFAYMLQSGLWRETNLQLSMFSRTASPIGKAPGQKGAANCATNAKHSGGT